MYVQNAYKIYYALILLLIGVFLIRLVWRVYQNGDGIDGVREAFQVYNVKPFKYMKTGRDPLRFYRKDIFRKPYRDLYKFYKSYPTPHYSFLD